MKLLDLLNAQRVLQKIYDGNVAKSSLMKVVRNVDISKKEYELWNEVVKKWDAEHPKPEDEKGILEYTNMKIKDLDEIVQADSPIKLERIPLEDLPDITPAELDLLLKIDFIKENSAE